MEGSACHLQAALFHHREPQTLKGAATRPHQPKEIQAPL
jgi:hypothetical protein